MNLNSLAQQASESNMRLTQYEEVYIIGSESLHIRLITQLLQMYFSNIGVEVLPKIDVNHCSDSRCLILINCQDFKEKEIITQLNDLFKHRNDLPVLLMNTDRNHPILDAAEMPNVRGIFESHCDHTTLVSGLNSVDQGNIWFPRLYADNLLKRLRLTPVKTDATANLSKREQEIMYLVSKGYSNEEIANNLYLSGHTIKTHLYRIYKKIGAKNRFQAMEWARQQQASS